MVNKSQSESEIKYSCNNIPNAKEKQTKHKSPARLRRDMIRSAKHHEQIKKKQEDKNKKTNEKVEVQTQTDIKIEVNTENIEEKQGETFNKTKDKQNLGKKVWRYLKRTKSKDSKHKVEYEEVREEEVKELKEEKKVDEIEKREDLRDEEMKKKNKDPTDIYKNFEVNLRLSRLEEEKTLTIALRHIVRNIHPKGRTITFPSLEAVDRIQLKSNNLPTDAYQLKSLVDQVFERREEVYDIEEIYQQFAMNHGRITIDPKQSWPNCQLYTKHP